MHIILARIGTGYDRELLKVAPAEISIGVQMTSAPWTTLI